MEPAPKFEPYTKLLPLDEQGQRLYMIIREAGGPSKVHRELGVSNAAIHGWIRGGKVNQATHAILLAEMLGIKVPPKLREIAGMPPKRKADE